MLQFLAAIERALDLVKAPVHGFFFLDVLLMQHLLDGCTHDGLGEHLFVTVFEGALEANLGHRFLLIHRCTEGAVGACQGKGLGGHVRNFGMRMHLDGFNYNLIFFYV